MKILIIGGSKFSGRFLTEKLAAKGHELTVMNRGTSPFEYPANCEHIVIDRID
jgi:2'-hydroxyisoflavone reductase